MRVWPNDLDLFGHVNNGVYLTVMDLARMDMLLRSGQFKPIFKNGWYPVVAGETIRFYRSLKFWQAYTITTEVAGWDDKSIFLTQKFESRGELIASAVVNARFLAKPTTTAPGRSVPTPEFLEFIGESGDAPELPGWIAQWHRALFPD